MRRLDIGIASYRNPEKLSVTLESVRTRSITEFACKIIHNATDDAEGKAALGIAERMVARDSRFSLVTQPNSGYAGAVARLMREHISHEGWQPLAYLDNDVVIQTHGWDATLLNLLDTSPEIGVAFPGNQPYMLNRGQFQECMWGVGFAWIATRQAITAAGVFDENIGHQEEADWCMRVRMAGFRCACAPNVSVHHDATATNDPAARERINRGVIAFVDKWNRYFNGAKFGYHSPNVTRWEDWPPNALYLEEFWRERLPTLNASPEVVNLVGAEYDLIRVPRLKEFYRGRVI